MSILDNYYAYRFVYLLTQSWENTDAFKLGLIDKDGNILKKKTEIMKTTEKEALSKFNLLVWNIKRLLDKVPFSKTLLGKFVTALTLLKESYPTIDPVLYEELIENFTGGIDITTPETFAGNRVFTVTPEYYQKSRFGKNKYSRYSKFVGDDETGQQIREYGRKNPSHGIVLKHSIDGSMLYLRKRKV